MKKVKRFLILIMLILLTGCSNYDMVMEIDKNKSMDFSITILSDTVDENISKNISVYKEKLEGYGYLVSEYNKDNKYGIIISKKYDNIDKVSLGKRSEEYNLLHFYSNDYDSEIESKMFNVDKGIDTNRYAANFYVDLSNLDIDLNNSVVTFKLYVPNGTESNNANLVSDDGNELIWNITSLGKTEIDFVFELKSYDYIYYGAAILIVIFLVFSIFGNLFTKKEENKGSVSKQINTRPDYDIDAKIANITKNAVNKNTSPNYNRPVPNNNVNSEVSQNVEFSKPAVNMDNIERREINESAFNRTVKSNSLVPEVDMASFKAPISEKKKGLFSKFNKKDKKKNNSTEGSDFSINNDNNFDAIVNSINNGNMGSSININSQVTTVTNIKNDEENINIASTFDNVNNDDNIPVIGGEYVDDNSSNNDVVNNLDKTEVISNPNLDVNNITSSVSSVDSFYYNKEDVNNGVSEEEEKETSEVDDGPVIRVNNVSVTTHRNKEDNL